MTVFIYSSLFIYIFSAVISSHIIRKVLPEMTASEAQKRVLGYIPFIPIGNTVFLLTGFRKMVQMRIERRKEQKKALKTLNNILKGHDSPSIRALKKEIKKFNRWWNI